MEPVAFCRYADLPEKSCFVTIFAGRWEHKTRREGRRPCFTQGINLSVHGRVGICYEKKDTVKTVSFLHTFLIRKVSKRISRQMHHFVLAKLLKFQETFLDLLFLKEKVGKRTSHRPHHFILAKLLKLQETFLDLLLLKEKVGKRTSHRPHHFILAKLLKIHKKLFSKSFLCQGLGQMPQLIMHRKKHGNAVLFNCRKWLELRSKPCFKVLPLKAP